MSGPAERLADPGACTERELVAPVDECRPDGRLNPNARGWSRVPAMLAPTGERTKRYIVDSASRKTTRVAQ